MTPQIILSEEILAAAPDLRVIAIEANINNAPTSDALWQEILSLGDKIHRSLAMEMVNKQPAIAATRAAYKRCGKDPNRYRPSAEALTRRMVKGMELYRTLTAIDLINLISVTTGHSIGGFDADKIQGATLTLGVGQDDEEFLAIGRGRLNIAGLPVYRDAVGGIGTPTSDCERTKLTPDTARLLMLVNVYDPHTDIAQLKQYISDTCARHGVSISIKD